MPNHNLNKQIIHDLRNYISPFLSSMEIIAENLAKYQQNQKLNGSEITDKDFLESIELANMLIPHSKETIKYLEDSLANEEIINNSVSPKLDLQELNIEEIINNLLDINQGFISENKITIKTEIEQDLPKLKTDVIKLKRILLNLINNAVKYSQNGSEVRIIAKRTDGSVRRGVNGNVEGQSSDANGVYIEVVDSGIGMNNEELSMALNGDGKKIDKSALDKPINSNGIGMTIIKDLVTFLGGKMQIESQKGVGTKVGLLFCNYGLAA